MHIFGRIPSICVFGKSFNIHVLHVRYMLLTSMLKACLLFHGVR